jgi:hypothetical protein
MKLPVIKKTLNAVHRRKRPRDTSETIDVLEA